MKNSKSKNPAHVREQVRAVCFKFYAEMIAMYQKQSEDERKKMTAEQIIENEKCCLQDFISACVLDLDCPYLIHGIIHDSDFCVPKIQENFNQEGLSAEQIQQKKEEIKQQRIYYYWNPNLEKVHLHLVLLTRSGCPVNLSTIYNFFESKGLSIRKDVDTIGLMSGWVQKLDMKKKAHIKMIVYHTHETDEAIQDGKHLYNRSEVYTNFSPSVLDKYYEIYVQTLSKRAKNTEFEIACKAGEYGEKVMQYRMGFTKFWKDEVPFSLQLNGKLEKNARMRYELGVEKMLQQRDMISIPRCCIYIHGIKDAGKSYTTKKVLSELGLLPYTVETDGNGQLDRLQPENQAIFYDDVVPRENLLNIADRKPCHVYRRNSGAPVWVGCYLIIANNMNFEEYLQAHFSKQSWFSSPRAYEALLSRFYVCEINQAYHNQLYCAGVAGGVERGGAEDIQIQRTLFKNFYMLYNQEILNYHPEEKQQIESFSDFLGSSVPAPAPAPAPATALTAPALTAPALTAPAPAPALTAPALTAPALAPPLLDMPAQFPIAF